MQNEIYLDNSATTPVAEEVVQAMEPYWSVQYGNPSSPHLRGVAAEKTMGSCRDQLAQLLDVHPSELYFTPSGTVANNLALLGTANTPYFTRSPGHIITTPIEHASVLNTVKHLKGRGWAVSLLDVDGHGAIEPEQIKDLIQPDTKLVSVMHVNNELGTIAPIKEISRLLQAENEKRRHKIVFHVDAVQALGNVPLNPAVLGVDTMSFSGHKIFGPKGIGLLYVGRNTRLEPLFFGGSQERGLWPGTENVPGIVGFTRAAQLAVANLEANVSHMQDLRRELLEGITAIEGAKIHNPPAGAPHILNVGFAGVRGEVLVHFLEQKRIFVAMGAACSAKRRGLSHVLRAVGLRDEEILGAVRISLSHQLSLDQIKYVVYSLKETVEEIRNIYM
ncbi:MAG TPA: cysteine desulfurase [Firmicutes bacterium]|nr:cysteine desulfurase [Bacillota bacterium]